MKESNMLDWQQAQDGATRTEPSAEQYKAAVERLNNPEIIRLLHGGIGLVTEAGEFVDMLKKHIFYGKPLDRVNLFEEGGDTSWYLRIIADCLEDLAAGKCSFEEMVDRNIRKLKARFPEKFTENLANNRDLDKERTILEGK